MRTGKGSTRHGFRTRKGGDLPCRPCPKCGREQYQVPMGEWQHWGTLVADCPAQKGRKS